MPDGTFTYYKDRYDKVMKNQHNLGTAFAVLFGIVEGKDAKKAIDNYPATDNHGNHNQVAWPFCDTFFLQAKESADDKDYTCYNAAILARTLGIKFSEKSNADWVVSGRFMKKLNCPLV